MSAIVRALLVSISLLALPTLRTYRLPPAKLKDFFQKQQTVKDV